jgi:GxxExxY protein
MKDKVFQLCDVVRETGYAIHRYHGPGHLEKVYENALVHRLRKQGLDVKQQHPLKVYDEDGTVIGEYCADLFNENCLIAELKAARATADEHVAQLLGYQRASRIEHGLLINFGASKFYIKKYAMTDRASASPTGRVATWLISVFASLFVLCGKSFGAETPDYARHIAPLFQQYCLDCHGKQDPEGGLVMETHEALMKGGDSGAAILPGKSADSLLVKFLEGRSGKEGKNQFMPPGKKKRLEPSEIALVKAWIDAGAKPSAEGAALTLNIPKIAPRVAVVKPINALAHSPAAKLLALGRYGEVELVNADTRAVIRTLAGPRGNVTALAFSADGAQLFAASGDPGLVGQVAHWSTADGKLIRSWEAHPDALYALALSPDGQTLATGSYDQRIKLWNAATGELLRELKGHNGAINGLAFRPDGRVLASASADRTVKLWNPATGARLDTFSQPLKELYCVAFSPDGKSVVAGGADNRLRLWQVSEKAVEGSNKLLYSRFAHEGSVLRVAFSADGRTLVSSAADRTVKVWNGVDVTERLLLEKQPDWAHALALTGDNRLVVGRNDGTLAFYNPDNGQALAPAAKKSAKLNLLPAASRTQVFAQARNTEKKAASAATKKKAADARAAMSGKPVLTRLEPPGVQRGVASEVRLVGKNLGALKSLKVSHPKVTAEIAATDPKKPDEATVKILADGALPRSVVEVSAVTEAGESGKLKLHVDDLPQVFAKLPPKAGAPVKLAALPVGVWGALRDTGEHDEFEFAAKAGQQLVFDLEARRIGSKATTPALQLLDESGVIVASNYGMENNTDPLLAFRVPRDGRYVIRVREVTLEGSADHTYHLTLGELPYVTGFFPISAGANRDVEVALAGYNLPAPTVRVKTGAAGKAVIPLQEAVRFRGAAELMVTDGAELVEAEPNDALAAAQLIPVPGSVNGRLFAARPGQNDADLFAFDARQGQQIVLETLAARAGSPADTRIEVLDAKGEPVPRMLFQAVRDSWVNFRRQDANQAGVRIANWEEMDLAQYVWFNGDIQRIFRMPRGPDADMIFFSNGGKRRAWFDTTATQHALDDPCYVVEPRPLGAKLVPNGLPVFTLYYANDDDGERELGADSRLLFTAPADGRYLARVTDTRCMGGERFAYRLTVRPAQPDFAVTLNTMNLTVSPGAGASFGVKVDRKDGFDGPVRVEFAHVPGGFTITSPVDVDPGHLTGEATLFAAEGAQAAPEDWAKLKITATATVAGRKVVHAVNPFAAVKLGEKPRLQLVMEPGSEEVLKHAPVIAPDRPLELIIAPGQTVPAMLRVVRHSETNLINLDVDGLPFGVIVDNIGLNGVQIRPGENEREIFLTAAKWVPEQEALCFAVTQSARNDAVSTPGTQTSYPVRLKVRRPERSVSAR